MRGFDSGQGTNKTKVVNKQGVCRMRLKTVVHCTWVGQAEDPTEVDSSLLSTPYLRQKSNRVNTTCTCNEWYMIKYQFHPSSILYANYLSFK
jgi:hypothetical protein